MNKKICPVCKKEKGSTGPKNIGEDETADSPHLVIKTQIMCNECYQKLLEVAKCGIRGTINFCKRKDDSIIAAKWPIKKKK